VNPVDPAFWLEIALPLVGGAALSFLVERVLQPTPAIAGRPWRAVAAHLGLWTLAFGIVLAVTQRPYFAALLVLGELLIFVIVSNAKLRVLREPFVFADFEAVKDVLKHPRLFLPYFGVGRALGGLAVFCLVIYLGFALEPGLPGRSGWPAFALGLATLAAAGAALVWLGTPRPLPLSFDATADLRRLGFPACLWYYALAERARHPVPANSRFHVSNAGSTTRNRPNLVVVQSESFFDARRLYPGIKLSLLEQFDAIRASAVHHGRLEVPAWGGNTARTEFAFLTGLASHEIGVHRFNPHRRLAQQGVPTLAAFLKNAGYRTVCVHPYPASFYSRNTAYPAFGFDRFVDLEHFRGAERYGPYVSDQAVAEMACELLEDSGQPTLMFVITMENHGPLHLERVAPGDVERLYAAPPPAGFDDLTVYLRHLANADRMMRVLQERLTEAPQDAWLCWYGDHVPILPKVYDATGYPDGRTDYFIWGKGRAPLGAAPRDLRVEELGMLLLEQAGLLSKTATG
jgi:hypothetical protein